MPDVSKFRATKPRIEDEDLHVSFARLEDHGVRDVECINPVPDARTLQNGLATFLQSGKNLRLWAQRVTRRGRPLPGPEHGTPSHADDLALPERRQARCDFLGREFSDGVERNWIAGSLFNERLIRNAVE